MRTLTFNFGNEANIITCIEHDDKTITIPAVTNSPVFNSMEELAQNYAQARGVKPENFKNWVLLDDNTCYTYVLRAGTAGIQASEIESQMTQAFSELRAEAGISPLDVNSMVSLLQGSDDVEATLTALNLNYPHLQMVINAIYAKLETAGCFTVEVQEVVVDTRSTFEKFLDREMSIRGTLAIVAFAVPTNVTATKEELLTAYNEVFGDSMPAFERFCIAYDALLRTLSTFDATTVEQALLVAAQTTISEPDEAIKTNLITVADLASRTSINIPVCRVGHTGVIMSAKYLPVTEVAEENLYRLDGTATIIRFDDTVDIELAERHTEHDTNRTDDYEYDEYDGDNEGNESRD